MTRIVFLLALAAATLAGFGFGSGYLPKKITRSDPAELVTEMKPFAIVLIAQNDAPWIERSLRSIFEQDYENFRLLFVDDGSSDHTYERVQEFIVENHQEHRVILMKNDTPLGATTSLARAIEQCPARTLVLPLSARDWLSSPTALCQLNAAFQSPKVRIAKCRSIRYPSYEFSDKGLQCFYSAMHKYQDSKKVKHLSQPISFYNETLPRD